MSTRLRFASCGWFTELTWLTWLVGGLVIGALVHFHLALAAYPVYFAERGSASGIHHSWTVGWPLPLATWSTTFDWNRHAPLTLLVDLALAAALVVGTMAAVQRWSRGQTPRLPANGQTLAAIVVSLLGWIVLIQTLSVPAVVFLGWAALVVIFLAVPCAAYALVFFTSQVRHSKRYSIRTLLVVVTVLCVAAAAVAWQMNINRAERAERIARVPKVRVESMDYGLMEAVDTHENGRWVSRDYRIVKRTDAIPCTLGTFFGVEYVLSSEQPSGSQDAPRQDHVRAYVVWHYPSEITDPNRGKKQRQSERQIQIRTGERDVEVFRLDSEPYLVLGQWKLEIWQDTGIPRERRKLLEQVFVGGEK